MRRDGVDVCLITTSDPHGSEYIHPRYETRRFFSGFTGDAGSLVVTADRAALWTDGRFFLQAAEELEGSGIELMRIKQPGVPNIEDFIEENVPENGVLAFDGELVTAGFGGLLRKKMLKKRASVRFDYDPAEGIWTDRPDISPAPIWVLDDSFTGMPAADKLAAVREKMKQFGADTHIISALDDIAWLFNLRGGDIPRNPVFFAWCVIRMEEAHIFLYEEALSAASRGVFDALGVTVHPYGDIWEMLAGLDSRALLLDPDAVNYRMIAAVPASLPVIRRPNPVSRMKHIKNDTEIGHIINSHRKDGAAMVQFMHWLDTQVSLLPSRNAAADTTAAHAAGNAVGSDGSGGAADHASEGSQAADGNDPADRAPVGSPSDFTACSPADCALTELSACAKLEQFRARQDGFIDLSFDTIAGYAAHGAIIHYTPKPESDVRLSRESFLLLDSGGQYIDGTTDITRTIALGPLTDEERLHYTLVLKCNLALERAHFPEGTYGENLDVIARQPLWERGLDFRHGTGHGVGFLLNVHEGPNGFRTGINAKRMTCAFAPGMVTTNEPGYYRDGFYGVRIENELLCVPFSETEYGKFLGFRNITLCPYDLSAIRKDLLTEEEIRQINDYHARVRSELAGLLGEEDRAWLDNATREI